MPQRRLHLIDAAEAPKATTNHQTKPTLDIYLDKNNSPSSLSNELYQARRERPLAMMQRSPLNGRVTAVARRRGAAKQEWNHMLFQCDCDQSIAVILSRTIICCTPPCLNGPTAMDKQRQVDRRSKRRAQTAVLSSPIGSYGRPERSTRSTVDVIFHWIISHPGIISPLSSKRPATEGVHRSNACQKTTALDVRANGIRHSG